MLPRSRGRSARTAGSWRARTAPRTAPLPDAHAGRPDQPRRTPGRRPARAPADGGGRMPAHLPHPLGDARAGIAGWSGSTPQKYAMLRTPAPAGQVSRGIRWLMSAYVSNGSTKAVMIESTTNGQPECLERPRHPELEGLGHRARQPLDHRAKLRIGRIGDQLGTQRGGGRRGDGEHHQIEVLSAPEYLRYAADRVRHLLLEVHPEALQALGVHELLPAWLARPARQPVHLDQRIVGGDGEASLRHHLDGVDRAPVGRQSESGRRVEELERHAAPAQHLVERREDRVSHAGLHLEEERALVGEHEPQSSGERHAGRQVLPGDVAVP